MKIRFGNTYYILFSTLCLYFAVSSTKVKFTIGVLTNDDNAQEMIPLKSVIYANNFMDQRNLEYAANIKLISNTDSFSTIKAMCNMTSSNIGVVAIIGPKSKVTDPIVDSISNFLELPHIQTYWHPAFKFSSKTSLNFHPDSELFTEGLGFIVKNFHWKSFAVLYETDEGLVRLQEVLKLQIFNNGKSNRINVRKIGSGPDYRTVLKGLKNSSDTQIILDCDAEKIMTILTQAKEVGMLNAYHNYFLTSLDAHTIDHESLYIPANITTIRIINPENEDVKRALNNWKLTEGHQGRKMTISPYKVKVQSALIHDAVDLFIQSLNALHLTQTHLSVPIDCRGSEKWEGGLPIIEYMKVKEPDHPLTGPLKFDKNGRRIDFTIYVIEGFGSNEIGRWSAKNPKVFYSNRTADDSINAVAKAWQKRRLVVSSRLGAPYLMKRTSNYSGELLEGNAKYEGYSMDLIAEIANFLNFTFVFKPAEDNNYGTFNEKLQEWDGILGDLINHRADLGICDLTITHARKSVVDFSMPFMTLGVSILHKKTQKKDVNMFAFLDPFKREVWYYTATLYLTLSVVLFFIYRMAPDDWENPHPCEENPEELENIWGLGNCFWLTLGSIMAQGCDFLPKACSSRLASSMWWFFSLIMTSSYTANLAAFLTAEKSEPSINSAEELMMQSRIKYGTVDKGATQAFFRESNYSTYERMWTSMESSKPGVFEKSNDDGVRRVLTTKNGLFAFLMESTQIDYEVETKCELRQVGDWLTTKYYGIAMPMHSNLRGPINYAVLKLQEQGRLRILKENWWKKNRKEPSCSENISEDSPSGSLELANVGGVFLVLGVGVGLAYIVAIIEFLWNVKDVSVAEHLTYREALIIELKFAINIWNTKKKTKPRLSPKSSESGDDTKSVAQSIVHASNSVLNINKIQINKS